MVQQNVLRIVQHILKPPHKLVRRKRLRVQGGEELRDHFSLALAAPQAQQHCPLDHQVVEVRLAQVLHRVLKVHHVAAQQELLEVLRHARLESGLAALEVSAVARLPRICTVGGGGGGGAVVVGAVLVIAGVLVRVVVGVLFIEVVLVVVAGERDEALPEPLGADALLGLLRVRVVALAVAPALGVRGLGVGHRDEVVALLLLLLLLGACRVLVQVQALLAAQELVLVPRAAARDAKGPGPARLRVTRILAVHRGPAQEHEAAGLPGIDVEHARLAGRLAAALLLPPLVQLVISPLVAQRLLQHQALLVRQKTRHRAPLSSFPLSLLKPLLLLRPSATVRPSVRPSLVEERKESVRPLAQSRGTTRAREEKCVRPLRGSKRPQKESRVGGCGGRANCTRAREQGSSQ
mmetsp:Transcript_12078/g.30637  ORF Transcript_12078/g.30637 Transcript_12078/m.30637 type:complete len:407 (+) Transcript_12078:1736-2956(+)